MTNFVTKMSTKSSYFKCQLYGSMRIRKCLYIEKTTHTKKSVFGNNTISYLFTSDCSLFNEFQYEAHRNKQIIILLIISREFIAQTRN